MEHLPRSRGARPGRPHDPLTQPVTRGFQLEAAHDALIEVAAAALGITRSGLLRRLIDASRPTLERAAGGQP